MHKPEIPNLLQLYKKLPSVPCQACGSCCVSPHCTLVEFVVLIGTLLKDYPKDQVAEILLNDPQPHPGYEGNLYCRFQNKTTRHCMVHDGRAMACRLFGLPAMNLLKISNLENCKKMTIPHDSTTVQSIQEWLTHLSEINNSFAPYYAEPYWIAGLNMECWLALYFDPWLNDGMLGELKTALQTSLNLSFLENKYRDYTDLKGKTDKIALLYELIKIGAKKEALELIADIRYGYPLTGTYYLDELVKIEKMLLKSDSD